MNIAALDKALKSVCPIDGVSVKDAADKTTWRIDFRPEATKEERIAAQAILDAFDPSAEEPVVKTLEERVAVLEAKMK